MRLQINAVHKLFLKSLNHIGQTKFYMKFEVGKARLNRLQQSGTAPTYVANLNSVVCQSFRC